mgnify:CR=1 FL=1
MQYGCVITVEALPSGEVFIVFTIISSDFVSTSSSILYPPLVLNLSKTAIIVLNSAQQSLLFQSHKDSLC